MQEYPVPRILGLTQKLEASLKKVNLWKHRAKVALCLDVSDSMNPLYDAGKIQRFAEKILALGCQFDDNGSIDIFLFAGNAQSVGSMNLENFHNFVNGARHRYNGRNGTMYGEAMKLIREFYFPSQKPWFYQWFHAPEQNPKPQCVDCPVYVMFVTDGATFDKPEAEQQLKWSSYQPIFWEFMAIGRGIFTFLEQLDNIGDRYLDNADFFNLDDPEHLSDEDLYDLLMTEYPQWVTLARQKNLLC